MKVKLAKTKITSFQNTFKYQKVLTKECRQITGQGLSFRKDEQGLVKQ